MSETKEEIKQTLTGYPSIDKPWLKYYTEADRQIEVPKCCIYQNIYEHNRYYLNDTAIIYFGNRITYGELFAQTDNCTKALRKIGIKKGDCAILCTAGVPEAIYIVLACSRIGAIANFINPMFTKEQMVARINETEAEWIFILDEMYEYIKVALEETCIKNVVIIPVTNAIKPIASKVAYLNGKARKILKRKENVKSFFSWNVFINKGKSYLGQIDTEYEENTPTVMVYSSGTTGASKGIQLTNDGINAFFTAYQATGLSDMAYQRGLKFLQMIPVWFSTGIAYSVLMPLSMGFKVVLEPKFSKESFAKDLKKYKPELTLTATSLWLHVVNNNLKIDLSNMKYPITGGEKILPLDEKRINSYLKRNGCVKRLYKGYGMCELGGEVTGTTDVQGYTDKDGGCGYPMLNVIVSSFNIDTDEELKYGEPGEIRVCSPARMKGYYKNPEATADFFKTDSQGRVWGCTGDIGYVDEDGEVFVLGRATDSAVMENGKRIYLFTIEDVILKDKDIVGCKVIDATENGKTILIAHIILSDESCMERESIVKRIDTECRAKLPEYAVPSKYKVRDAFPVHNNGKRDVEALRKETEGFIVIR